MDERDDDRDPEIEPMSAEEAATFEFDMDVFVTMYEDRVGGRETSFAEAQEEVRRRRREDRELERQWRSGGN